MAAPRRTEAPRVRLKTSCDDVATEEQFWHGPRANLAPHFIEAILGDGGTAASVLPRTGYGTKETIR